MSRLSLALGEHKMKKGWTYLSVLYVHLKDTPDFPSVHSVNGDEISATSPLIQMELALLHWKDDQFNSV